MEGAGTITDSEDIVANEVGDRNFQVSAQLSPLERDVEIPVFRKCVGGEVAVRPEKVGVFSKSQACQGKSQSPVVWIAVRRETE